MAGDLAQNLVRRCDVGVGTVSACEFEVIGDAQSLRAARHHTLPLLGDTQVVWVEAVSVAFSDDTALVEGCVVRECDARRCYLCDFGENFRPHRCAEEIAGFDAVDPGSLGGR